MEAVGGPPGQETGRPYHGRFPVEIQGCASLWAASASASSTFSGAPLPCAKSGPPPPFPPSTPRASLRGAAMPGPGTPFARAKTRWPRPSSPAASSAVPPSWAMAWATARAKAAPRPSFATTGKPCALSLDASSCASSSRSASAAFLRACDSRAMRAAACATSAGAVFSGSAAAAGGSVASRRNRNTGPAQADSPVHAAHHHDAIPLHRLLAQGKLGALLAGEIARDHRQIAPDALVGNALRPGAVHLCERRIEVDGAGALAQVERDGGRSQLVECGGEQVLGVVLLHVIESARPVDLGRDLAGLQRLGEEVEHGPAPLLGIEDLHTAQRPPVAGLAAPFGIERSAIEDGGGPSVQLADLQHAGAEGPEVGIPEIETLCHRDGT